MKEILRLWKLLGYEFHHVGLPSEYKNLSFYVNGDEKRVYVNTNADTGSVKIITVDDDFKDEII